MFKIEIQLDREKIKREGKYNVAKMELYIDKLCMSNGVRREPTTEDKLVYVESAPEKGFAEMGCIYFDLKYNKELLQYLKNCILWEEKSGNWYDEELFEEHEMK